MHVLIKICKKESIGKFQSFITTNAFFASRLAYLKDEFRNNVMAKIAKTSFFLKAINITFAPFFCCDKFVRMTQLRYVCHSS